MHRAKAFTYFYSGEGARFDASAICNMRSQRGSSKARRSRTSRSTRGSRASRYPPSEDATAVAPRPSASNFPDTSTTISDVEWSWDVQGVAEEAEKDGNQVAPYMNASAANRAQLLQRFYDLHLGVSSGGRKIFAYESLDLGNPLKQGLQTAMDSLCIAQLATTFEDSRLRMTAKSLYQKSLLLLNAKLSTIDVKRPDIVQLDDVIGGIHALTTCAWFDCIGADSLDWARHTRATLHLLNVFGWKAIHPSTAQSFYYNWKYRAFFDGLTRRVKVSFKEPPPELSASESSMPFLSAYAFDVPGLLWRTDRFCEAVQSRTVGTYLVLRMLTELGICIARLKTWYLQWLKIDPPRKRYRIVNTKAFESFKLLCGNYLGVFPLAYDTSHTQYERDFRIYNLCILNLAHAIMDIHAAYPEHCRSAQAQIQLREADSDAAASAADLCMLIPWSSQPQNMAFASIHSFLPLHYASLYYERQGKPPELAWCRQVTQSLRTKYGLTITYPR